MATFADLGTSKYLTKNDLGPKGALLLTIKGFSHENVAKANEAAALKYVAHFKEADTKPMVLNKTNGNRIAQIARLSEADDMDLAINTKIVVYFDPDVEMMGVIKGGLRIRAPKNSAGLTQPLRTPQAAQRPIAPPPQAHVEFDEGQGFVDPEDVAEEELPF